MFITMATFFSVSQLERASCLAGRLQDQDIHVFGRVFRVFGVLIAITLGLRERQNRGSTERSPPPSDIQGLIAGLKGNANGS